VTHLVIDIGAGTSVQEPKPFYDCARQIPVWELRELGAGENLRQHCAGDIRSGEARQCEGLFPEF
jgi:hypothetical protein